MNMIDKEIKEAIKNEKYLQLPFTTNYQEEAKGIVQNLWKDEIIHFGKKWINASTRIVIEEHPIVYIIEDSESNIQIMIENFGKYCPYEGFEIKFHSSSYELFGVSILAIMDSLHRIFLEVEELHKRIIEINKSNIDISSQKYFIRLAIKDIDKLLDDNIHLLDFSYPRNIIEDLNDLHLYHSWIDKNDSFFIELALSAYRDIIYYNKWIEKHDISDKHFLEKKAKIHKMYKSVIKYYDIKSNYHYGKLPQHPQDILHGLFSFYNDYYQKDIKDSAIQDIIKIISDYKRMPKMSKSNKNMKMIQILETAIINTMKVENFTQEEILNFTLNFMLNLKFNIEINEETFKEIEDTMLTDSFLEKLFYELASNEDMQKYLPKKS